MAASTVADLSEQSFADRLRHQGISVAVGPFNFRLQVDVERIGPSLYTFYRDYPLLSNDVVYSFHARMTECRAFPRFYRQMVRFTVDGRKPHEEMPAYQALPVFEWGLNLLVAIRSHGFLMLHSAVLERNGDALLLPASPGHGKSTLCAGLSHHGWRTLSDEFGLVRPSTRRMVPVPRPMALKNESIELIRDFAPNAIIGPETHNTRKGTVAHVKPTSDSIYRQSETAAVRMIVFPRWVPDASFKLNRMSRGEGFMLLATNAFNYELLGEEGFSTVRDIVKRADCFHLTYSDLEDAVERLTMLFDQHALQ